MHFKKCLILECRDSHLNLSDMTELPVVKNSNTIFNYFYFRDANQRMFFTIQLL